MSNGQDVEEKERERKVRRKIFYLTFAILALICGGFLVWKLSGLILPIIVGALLAFLFRPVKDRFMKYCAGHDGKPPVQSKFVDYFWANQRTREYVIPEKPPSGSGVVSPTG